MTSEPERDEPPPCPGRCSGSGRPVWCPSCKKIARSAVTELDRLMIWLEHNFDGFGSRSPGTFVSGGKGDPVSPSPVADLLDRAYANLVEVEAAWRRHQGYMPTRRTSLGRTSHDRAITLAFIAGNLDGILRTKAFVEDVKMIINWRTVLQKMAHAEPEPWKRPGRCPRCHMVGTLRTDLVLCVITCEGCPLEMTEEQYLDEVVDRADPAMIAESMRAAGLLDT